MDEKDVGCEVLPSLPGTDPFLFLTSPYVTFAMIVPVSRADIGLGGVPSKMVTLIAKRSFISACTRI
jgi:hypothetical protein